MVFLQHSGASIAVLFSCQHPSPHNSNTWRCELTNAYAPVLWCSVYCCAQAMLMSYDRMCVCVCVCVCACMCVCVRAGLGVLDAVSTRLSRTTGLLEDLRLWVEVQIVKGFAAFRTAVRTVTGGYAHLSHSHGISRNTAWLVQSGPCAGMIRYHHSHGSHRSHGSLAFHIVLTRPNRGQGDVGTDVILCVCVCVRLRVCVCVCVRLRVHRFQHLCRGHHRRPHSHSFTPRRSHIHSPHRQRSHFAHHKQP